MPDLVEELSSTRLVDARRGEKEGDEGQVGEGIEHNSQSAQE